MRTFFLIVGGLCLGIMIGNAIAIGDYGTAVLGCVTLACMIGYIIVLGIELDEKIKEIKKQVLNIKSFLKH